MTTGEMLVAKVQELKTARGEIKPPKPVKDSPAANLIGFWMLAISALIGAIPMLAVTLAERPAAILPLMLFLGTAAAGIGVMHNQVLSAKPREYESRWLCWFTATGVIIALILAAGLILMIFTQIIRAATP